MKTIALLAVALSLSACSSSPEKVQANVNKIRAVAVKVRAGLQQVEIYGCAGAEVLTAAYPEVKDLIPPGADAEEIGRVIAVAGPVIEKLCTKAQMQQR